MGQRDRPGPVADGMLGLQEMYPVRALSDLLGAIFRELLHRLPDIKGCGRARLPALRVHQRHQHMTAEFTPA